MIIILALLSAFVFGSGVVLQQRSAMEVPAEHAARPGLLLRLVRRPLWMLGLGADVLGFGLQALALHKGSLVVVQPLITTSLLFTLVLTAAFYREPISVSEWAAMIVVLAGLSVFLAAAAPSEEGGTLADAQGWLLCALSVVLVTLAAVLIGLRAAGAVRAGLFGLAAGIADAFMAVLAKAFAGSFNHGVVAVFEGWTPWALLAGGLAAILLISTAYQAGHPTVSLPIITVTDPLVGSIIGVLLFDEHLRLGGTRGVVVAFALLGMAGGLVTLGRDHRLASEVAGEVHNAGPTGPTMVEPT
jgi:drug/metabolite transporter (DMT)-like permease